MSNSDVSKTDELHMIANTKGTVFIYQINEKPEEDDEPDEYVDASQQNVEFIIASYLLFSRKPITIFVFVDSNF